MAGFTLNAGPVVKVRRISQRETGQKIVAIELRRLLELFPESRGGEAIRRLRRAGGARKLNRTPRSGPGLAQSVPVAAESGAKVEAQDIPFDQEMGAVSPASQPSPIVGRVGVSQSATQIGERAAQRGPTLAVVTFRPEQRDQLLPGMQVPFHRQINEQSQRLTRAKFDRLAGVFDQRVAKKQQLQMAHLTVVFAFGLGCGRSGPRQWSDVILDVDNRCPRPVASG